MGVRIFSGGSNSGFFQRGITVVKFYFTHSKLTKKTFSAENITGWQILKSRGPRPGASLSTPMATVFRQCEACEKLGPSFWNRFRRFLNY